MMLGNPSEILGNEGVVCMIREERLLGVFRELVSIDNPTLRERGVCDYLLRRYAALGIRLQEDGTGADIGGNAGNLYAFAPGDEALAPVLLSAHTDAVSPACGKRAVLHLRRHDRARRGRSGGPVCHPRGCHLRSGGRRATPSHRAFI